MNLPLSDPEDGLAVASANGQARWPATDRPEIDAERWHWGSAWYLNGENGRGKRRHSFWCHACRDSEDKPVFKSREEHRRHMFEVHGASAYWHDLSFLEQRDQAQALFERVKARQESSEAIKGEVPSCGCQLSEMERASPYLNELHFHVADHYILESCAGSATVVRKGELDALFVADCDSERLAQSEPKVEGTNAATP